MIKLSTAFVHTGVLVALIFVSACREPAATPPLPLPAVERPVITLKTANDPSRKARILIPRGAYVERFYGVARPTRFVKFGDAPRWDVGAVDNSPFVSLNA